MITTQGLERTFVSGTLETKVLKGIDFEAGDGEFIAIMGRSGAGKSTFLYQLSLLDYPTGGTITINGVDTHEMSEAERVTFRLHNFGYVFQDYALLPELTALENVALPLLMQGKTKKEAYAVAGEALKRMNLGKRLHNLPSQLSGGEQQRVSIARSVAHNPHVLFADEPTANLDNESSETVMNIFLELHKAGQTIIMVTHEEEYARQAGRLVVIDDGKILKEEYLNGHKPTHQELKEWTR
jgi:putative ABC transport system ATP-binding protein